MYKIILEGGTEFLVSLRHRVYGKVEDNDLSFVSFVMMLKSKKDNSLSRFVDFKPEDKTLKDMNSSLTFKIIPQWFVMRRILDDLFHLFFNAFSKNRIFSARFIDLFFTFRVDDNRISHFSNISSTDFSLMKGPLFLSSSSLTNSSLNGSSSTGCQSIFSQNFQSSSVISPVCLYLSDMSRFISLITALTKNSESNLNLSFIINSVILSLPNKDIEDNYITSSDFKLMKITEAYEQLKENQKLIFLDENLNPVNVKSITKENYKGKIYDVDVPNDIILVRRKREAVWSGNSNTHVYDFSGHGNNGTVYGNPVYNISGGKFAGAFIFDGGDDYILITAND